LSDTQRANRFRADPQPSAQMLTHQMQLDAQKWNDLLWSSGGALEIPKCSFHLIESDWRSDGSPFLKGNVNAPNIYVSNGLVPSQVKQKSNYDSHKTLGCYANPANRMESQVKQLKKKSNRQADMVLSNALQRSEARTNYAMIYLPSITYTFPVTCLTRDECTQVQAKFMTAIVPRCGFNRSMSLAVRYSPKVYGGAGFTELYTEQGALGTMMALKHLRSPNGQPGAMLRIMLSWAQAFSGTSKFIWSDTSTRIPRYPHHGRYIFGRF